jgi:hypothetical protein
VGREYAFGREEEWGKSAGGSIGGHQGALGQVDVLRDEETGVALEPWVEPQRFGEDSYRYRAYLDIQSFIRITLVIKSFIIQHSKASNQSCAP